MLNRAPYDKSLGHIKDKHIRNRGKRVEEHSKVDMAKGGWKPTPKKVPRGKPTPTNHTHLATLTPDDVKWGEKVKH